jgi:hypothetical protein
MEFGFKSKRVTRFRKIINRFISDSIKLPIQSFHNNTKLSSYE